MLQTHQVDVKLTNFLFFGIISWILISVSGHRLLFVIVKVVVTSSQTSQEVDSDFVISKGIVLIVVQVNGKIPILLVLLILSGKLVDQVKYIELAKSIHQVNVDRGDQTGGFQTQ
jgi:hypothetical protein